MTGSALRIGLVIPRFAPFHGGAETHAAQAAAALAGKGAEVTVITQAPRGARLPQREAIDGYHVERYHLPFGDNYDLPAPAVARAAWRAGRFDVVWVHNYHTFLTWLAAEWAKVPAVLTPHFHGGGHTPLRDALHRAYRPAGQRLMAVSRRIVVDSDAEAELILREFPHQVQRDKITVIPLAVTDPVRDWRPYPGASDVVLTVARQEPYKRTDLLIRAVAELRSRAVPVRLVVVGDGPGLVACRELAARLGADDVVTFTGHADDETLGRWWASAAVYATASLHEAFGIGLGQALLAGLPVVASDIPAHHEVVHRAGPEAVAKLCRADVPDAEAASCYADAIAQLLQSPGACPQRAQRCALIGVDEMADRLLETFRAASMVSRE